MESHQGNSLTSTTYPSLIEPRGEWRIYADDAQVRDFYEQVLRAHWDIARCFCPVCYVGRALGFRPSDDVEVRPEMAAFAKLLHPFMESSRVLGARQSMAREAP